MFEGDVGSCFVDKQYFSILLFQTAGGAVSAGGGAPDVLLSIWEHWLFNFPFTVILKWLSGKGSSVFYFKFPDEIGPTSMHEFCFLPWLATRSLRPIVAMFQLHLEYVVSSGMAFKIWKFWDKTGFLNYLCGFEMFCTVTCHFLWDTEQTTGRIIIIISEFWDVCFFSVELLEMCSFLISSLCSLP